MVTRAGAKTMELRRERAAKIALDNKLLVGRMRRILTHSVPVWEDSGALGAGSAIRVDHLSVLRPESTRRKKKVPTNTVTTTEGGPETGETSLDGVDIDLGMSATMTTNELNEQRDDLAPLDYSADFGDSFDLDKSNILDRSANNLETSNLSVQFKDVPASKLEESFATAPVGNPSSGTNIPMKSNIRPTSAKSLEDKKSHQISQMNTTNNSTNNKSGGRNFDLPLDRPRPNTAGGSPSKKLVSDLISSDARPRSAATAPLFGRSRPRTASNASGNKIRPSTGQRRSSVVSSKTGQARLREAEKIARENEKIVRNMSEIGAYYSNKEWSDSRKSQMERMARHTRHKKKLSVVSQVKKEGLRDMFAFARENRDKIDQWEVDLARRIKEQSVLRVTETPEEYRRRVAKEKRNERIARKEAIAKKREIEELANRRESAVEQFSEVSHRQSASIKGTAAAASKFHNILVKNEQRRLENSKFLKLVASAASNECRRLIENKHKVQPERRQSLTTLNKEVTESEGIELIRKTVLQNKQDMALQLEIDRQINAKGVGGSKYDGVVSTHSDFLEQTLKYIAERKVGEEDVIGAALLENFEELEESRNEQDDKSKVDKGAPMRNFRKSFDGIITSLNGSKSGRGDEALAIPPFIDKEAIRLNVIEKRIGDVEVDWTKRSVEAKVVAKAQGENVIVKVRGIFRVGGKGEQILKLVKKLPMLCLGDWDKGVQYSKKLVARLEIVREESLGEEVGAKKEWNDRLVVGEVGLL